MKTTLEIDDAVLIHAKQCAAAERRPLRAFVEDALRDRLEAKSKVVREHREKWVTAKGGVPDEVEDREAMYNGMLQTVLDDREIKEIRRVARDEDLTVAEWVRQALLSARQKQSECDIAMKIQAVRGAAAHDYPTDDIEVMLGDIFRGAQGAIGT